LVLDAIEPDADTPQWGELKNSVGLVDCFTEFLFKSRPLDRGQGVKRAGPVWGGFPSDLGVVFHGVEPLAEALTMATSAQFSNVFVEQMQHVDHAVPSRRAEHGALGDFAAAFL
jgi:hypothetical protein